MKREAYYETKYINQLALHTEELKDHNKTLRKYLIMSVVATVMCTVAVLELVALIALYFNI